MTLGLDLASSRVFDFDDENERVNFHVASGAYCFCRRTASLPSRLDPCCSAHGHARQRHAADGM